MSFNDVTSTNNMIKKPQDNSQVISQSLQRYNTAYTSLNRYYINSTNNNTNNLDSKTLNMKIKDCRDCESNVKVQLNIQLKRFKDNSSSSSSSSDVQQRVALLKLQKDFESIQKQAHALLQKVSINLSARNGMTSESANNSNSDGNINSRSNLGNGSNVDDYNTITGRLQQQDIRRNDNNNNMNQKQQQQQQQQQVVGKMFGHEIDEAIAEERDRDLRQINNDLKMVNEMFRDVAQLVEDQSAPIDEIAQMTEESNARAEAGLEQVQQAARYQPGCSIS